MTKEIGTDRYPTMTTTSLLGALAEAADVDAVAELVVVSAELGRRIERGECAATAEVSGVARCIAGSQPTQAPRREGSTVSAGENTPGTGPVTTEDEAHPSWCDRSYCANGYNSHSSGRRDVGADIALFGHQRALDREQRRVFVEQYHCGCGYCEASDVITMSYDDARALHEALGALLAEMNH